MEKFYLADLTVNDEYTADRLSRYLEKVSGYKPFDEKQKVRLFYDPEGDFIAFEGVKYKLFFCGSGHKLFDDLSKQRCEVVEFWRFRERVKQIRGEA